MFSVKLKKSWSKYYNSFKMPWRFEGCRQRIARAKAHREALAKIWNDIAATDFYNISVRVEDDGTGGIWLKPTYGPDFTHKAALQLGEMLYQLRATLDACVYEAAVVDTGKNPPPNERSLEFPIAATKAAFQNSASKIRPLAQKRRDIIESVQPYNIPKLAPEDLVFNFNRTFGILNDWARKDRHRKLHVVGSWASNARPKVRCPAGTSLDYLNFIESGFLETESQIAAFKVKGYAPHMRIEANPDLDLDMGINELPLPCADNDTLGNRLRAMLVATYSMVRTFEDSF